MITARPLLSIEQQLQGVNRLEIQANIDDLRTYIEDRICCARRLARLVKNNCTLQESIILEVVKKASGMYVLLISALPRVCVIC